MTAIRTHCWLTRWMLVAVAVAGLVALSSPARAVASEAGRSSTVLVRGAGFDRPQGSEPVKALQRRLRAVGSAPGPVDGRFGPLTEAAVRSFQHAQGLASDGIVGPRTNRPLRARVALARGAGGGLPHGSGRVRSLQRHLRTLGAHPGPIDGRFGPWTEAAVRRFQHTRGLEATGIVDPRTQRRLARMRATRASAQRASERPPAHRHPTVAAKAAKKPGTSPGGPDLVEVALLVALAAVAVVLLFAGGRRWRRRRRAAPDHPTTPPGPAMGDHRPAPAPTGTPAPRAAPVARAMPMPHNGPAGRARPVSHEGSAGRARSASHKGSAERARPTSQGVPAVRARPAAREAAGPEVASVPQAVRALGYVSVSAESAVEPTAGPQVRAIEAACAARGWTFVGGVREPEPANARGLERPGLEHALGRLQRGEANCLVVAELRRLTRSVVELGGLLDRLGRAGVRLLVLDLGIDTGTEGGHLAASALTTVGGWEHERLAERARKGLAAARASGAAGRPAVSDRPELVKQITTMRASGMTLRAIAEALNAEGAPTVRGGTRWRPSSVQTALGYKRRPRGTGPASNPKPPTGEAERWTPEPDTGPPNQGQRGYPVGRGKGE